MDKYGSGLRTLPFYPHILQHVNDRVIIFLIGHQEFIKIKIDNIHALSQLSQKMYRMFKCLDLRTDIRLDRIFYVCDHARLMQQPKQAAGVVAIVVAIYEYLFES